MNVVYGRRVAECPVVEPPRGSESCSYADLRLTGSRARGGLVDFDRQLGGAWFLTAFSRRLDEPPNGQLYHFDVGDSQIELKVASISADRLLVCLTARQMTLKLKH